MKKDLTRQQIHLNIPKNLLEEIKRKAAQKKWSVTTFIIDLLENSLGKK